MVPTWKHWHILQTWCTKQNKWGKEDRKNRNNHLGRPDLCKDLNVHSWNKTTPKFARTYVHMYIYIHIYIYVYVKKFQYKIWEILVPTHCPLFPMHTTLQEQGFEVHYFWASFEWVTPFSSSSLEESMKMALSLYWVMWQ